MGYSVNRTYITPLKSDGTLEVQDGAETTWDNARGAFTLTAGTTYYFVLPIGAGTMFDCHLTHDAAIVITTATLETCSHGRSEVSDYSAIAGEWIDQDPPTGDVGTVGAGTTDAVGVVTVAGGSAGGASWQGYACGAARMRLTVVVGATGGEVRVSFCGKE